jgi:hypothetical protein
VTSTISDKYAVWEAECTERFNQLKANEEEINRIFIDIYGLQDELTTEVADKDVTVLKADLQREIHSLISYAIGCMFGRYSLDKDGLVLANQGETLEDYLVQIPNPTFLPDTDNIIPILDDEWFADDVVSRFKEFLIAAYGNKMLNGNLKASRIDWDSFETSWALKRHPLLSQK